MDGTHVSLFAAFADGSYSLLDDICQHLQLLLNTRQGQLVHEPEYGLPTCLGQHQQVHSQRLVQSIAALISRYEQRIVLQHIEVLPRRQELVSLHLHGQLRDGTSCCIASRLRTQGDWYCQR